MRGGYFFKKIDVSVTLVTFLKVKVKFIILVTFIILANIQICSLKYFTWLQEQEVFCL